MASKNKRNNLLITDIMQKKGMMLADLAQRIYEQSNDPDKRLLASSTLCARINGNPSLSSLYEVANALGVKITELFPPEDQREDGMVQRNDFHLQTTCPVCGARITASVSAE